MYRQADGAIFNGREPVVRRRGADFEPPILAFAPITSKTAMSRSATIRKRIGPNRSYFGLSGSRPFTIRFPRPLNFRSRSDQPAVGSDVLPGDPAGILTGKQRHHVGNVLRLARTDSRLLLPFGSKRRRLMNEVNRKTKRTATAIRRGLDEE